MSACGWVGKGRGLVPHALWTRRSTCCSMVVVGRDAELCSEGISM